MSVIVEIILLRLLKLETVATLSSDEAIPFNSTRL